MKFGTGFSDSYQLAAIFRPRCFQFPVSGDWWAIDSAVLEWKNTPLVQP